ncbi:hypothetical protein QBC43DRAFT_330896 [Cladorrhinum sp. PSN259]|nr:hypothetical protein QBC43DRAFT_330896 [Cladorrhinum sp. PSN259]
MMAPRFCTLFVLFLLQTGNILAQVTDINALGCATAAAIVSACASLSPQLSTATAFAQLAPCYCYSSLAWAPSIFDNAHTRCYSWLSSVSPQAVASETSRLGGPIASSPCGQAGNIRGATTTATEQSIVNSRTTDVNYQACLTIQGAANQCASLTPGFQSITEPKSQASCFCYSGLVWNPGLYDGLWGSCLSYLSTGSPSQYSALVNRPGGITTSPCALAGDIRAGVTPTPGDSTSFSTPTRTSSTTSTSTSGPGSNAAGGGGRDLRRSSGTWMAVGFVVFGAYMMRY